MKSIRGNLIALLAIIVIVVLAREFRQQGLAVGEAPDLEASNLHGDLISLSNLRDRPLLLHFWATWCSICRFEQDTIEAIARDWPVLTVAMQSGGDQALSDYMTQHGLTAETVNDPEGRHAARFGVRAVPTSFILDGHGRIRFAEVGYTTGFGLRFRLWLTDIL